MLKLTSLWILTSTLIWLTCFRIKTGPNPRNRTRKRTKCLPASRAVGDSGRGVQGKVAEAKSSLPKVVRPPSLPVAIIRSKRRSIARRHIHRVVDELVIPAQSNVRRSARLAPAAKPDPSMEVTCDSKANVSVQSEKNTEHDVPNDMVFNENDQDSLNIVSAIKSNKQVLLEAKPKSRKNVKQPLPTSILRNRKQSSVKKKRTVRPLRSSITERQKSLRSYGTKSETLPALAGSNARKTNDVAPVGVPNIPLTWSQDDAKCLLKEQELEEQLSNSEDQVINIEKKSSERSFPTSMKKRWIDYATASYDNFSLSSLVDQLTETNLAARPSSSNFTNNSTANANDEEQARTECSGQSDESKVALTRKLSLKQQINEVAKAAELVSPCSDPSKIVRQPAKIRMKCEKQPLPSSIETVGGKQHDSVLKHARTTRHVSRNHSLFSTSSSRATTRESYTVIMQSPIFFCDEKTSSQNSIARYDPASNNNSCSSNLSNGDYPAHLPVGNARKRKITNTRFGYQLYDQSSKKMKLDCAVARESKLCLPPCSYTQKLASSPSVHPSMSTSSINHMFNTCNDISPEPHHSSVFHPSTFSPMRRLSCSSPELLLPSSRTGLQRPDLPNFSFYPPRGSSPTVSQMVPLPFKNPPHIIPSILPPLPPHSLPSSFARPDPKSDAYLRRTLSLDRSPPGMFPFQNSLSQTPPSNLTARP